MRELVHELFKLEEVGEWSEMREGSFVGERLPLLFEECCVVLVDVR